MRKEDRESGKERKQEREQERERESKGGIRGKQERPAPMHAKRPRPEIHSCSL